MINVFLGESYSVNIDRKRFIIKRESSYSKISKSLREEKSEECRSSDIETSHKGVVLIVE